MMLFMRLDRPSTPRACVHQVAVPRRFAAGSHDVALKATPFPLDAPWLSRWNQMANGAATTPRG